MSEPTEKTVRLGVFGFRSVQAERIDAELLVEHLMRTAAYHVMTKTPYARAAISTEIKDALFKSDRPY